MKRRAGFTLIELLLTIAIIGVLSTILLPSLFVARSRAFDTAAVACAKQIGIGQELYYGEFATYAAGLGQLDAGTVVGCDPSWVSGFAGSVLSFSATVAHPSGVTSYTVTPQGITN